MNRASTEEIQKRCGTCKWLTGGVEPKHLRKDGAVKDRYNNTMFSCSVPFEAPKHVPACIEMNYRDRRYMAPNYGVNCCTWEPR